MTEWGDYSHLASLQVGFVSAAVTVAVIPLSFELLFLLAFAISYAITV